MKVTLLTHTPEPEKIIAAAAKLCYSDCEASEIMKNLTEENTNKFVARLESMGHFSPFEHPCFTFSVDGCSRSATHQLVRHRHGSFSQRSQRYVGENMFSYVIPEEIKSNEKALKIFETAMNNDQSAYDDLVDILMESGLDDKIAFENARAVLPNACCTSIVVTMNVRELHHFFKMRCCNRAQDEIRAVADEMLRICREVSPVLFKHAGAPCVSGSCPEGEMGCKNPRK